MPRGWSVVFSFAMMLAGSNGVAREPVLLIFDTDVGNDIDDALALSVIHALQARYECKLLAVTVTKDNPYAAPFIDAVNTFHGYPNVPVGVVREGKTPEDGKFIRPIAEAVDDGKHRYPHDLLSGKDAPEAVGLLRKTLASQPNGSVVIVQVGFSTNLVRLLDSKGDAVSPLPGRELAAQKCRLLSIMAGNFASSDRTKEYNVFIDSPAARKLFSEWPTPNCRQWFRDRSGDSLPGRKHSARFRLCFLPPGRRGLQALRKMPYDRQTWDLTSVLYAIRPDQGYFGLSDPGTISVDDADVTQFDFKVNGKHRYLTVTPEQIIRTREALILLASQPPEGR